jgi:hypothetical protein
MNKETLKEAAERFYPVNSTGGAMEMLSRHQLNNCLKQEGFIEGAKWMQERMYSEEDMKQFAEWLIKVNFNYTSNTTDVFLIWKKQFKKK